MRARLVVRGQGFCGSSASKAGLSAPVAETLRYTGEQHGAKFVPRFRVPQAQPKPGFDVEAKTKIGGSVRFIPEEVVADFLGSEPELRAGIESVYEQLEGCVDVEDYHRRHMIPSLGILTITSQKQARRVVKPLRALILNKTVVEIGAGVGLLALEVARYSPKVFAIESDPGWSWLFMHHLYQSKPPHLTWIMGRAEEVAGLIKADIALIVTHSGHREMQAVARRMAPEVIDVYERFPELRYDRSKA